MRHSTMNMMNPSTTSYSWVGYTETTADGLTPAGIVIPNSCAIVPAVDGGAPAGNATARKPFHGRP